MLLSRVADAMYWIGRYLERAEHTARIVGVRLDLGLDRTADGWDFEPLYASLGREEKTGLPTQPAELVEALMFDASNPGSAAACVTAARENARQVREEINSQMWQQINELFLRVRQARSGGVRPHYITRLVIDGIHLFQGVTAATMTHGEGWQYLEAGRFLERATNTSALLDPPFRQVPSAPSAALRDQVAWIALLRSCSALEAYCRCYTADLQPARIAEFLLLNSEFPRSLRYSVSRVEESLRALSLMASRPAGGQAERLAGRLNASLGYGQIDEILQDPQAFLVGIERQCDAVHAALYQTYITYRIETALPA